MMNIATSNKQKKEMGIIPYNATPLTSEITMLKRVAIYR